MEILHLVDGQPVQYRELSLGMPDTGFIWIDITRDEELIWPQQVEQITGVHIDERHVADCDNSLHPSHYEGTSEYDRLIFRSLTREQPENDIATRSTVFFMLGYMALVTVRDRDSRSVGLIRQRLMERGIRRPNTTAALMHLILGNMVDRFMSLREPLAVKVAVWRDVLLDPSEQFTDWRSVLKHSQHVRKLEMLCEEQEEALHGWRENTDIDLDDALLIRTNDILEHIQRMTRFSHELARDVESVIQLHFSAVAHRTNEIVRVLTVLSAIFLPLTLISGIFGMNFQVMPGLSDGHGFFYTILGMVGLAGALLLWLRMKDWF